MGLLPLEIPSDSNIGLAEFAEGKYDWLEISIVKECIVVLNKVNLSKDLKFADLLNPNDAR